jgi:bud emergence protein 1
MQSYNGGSMLNGNRSSRGIAPGTLVAPISASVDSYNFENSRYWYVMNAVMEDGRSWSLCRFYEDFYDFQIALLDEFREEAGHTGSPRKLPYMPGPVTYVTDTISAARRQSLDDYIKKLLSMEPYISKCRLVKQLFAPRPGDVEQTQYRELSAQDHRRSATSQLSSDSSREPSRQSSAHNLNGNAGGNGYPGLTAPPPRHSTGAQSRITNGTIAQAQQVHIRNATASTTTTSGQFLKIKIEYNDEMIAVRLPKDVSFAQLQDKLQERLGTVNLNTIQYRDEASGQVMDMFGDNDLTNALSRNPKLKLFIN